MIGALEVGYDWPTIKLQVMARHRQSNHSLYPFIPFFSIEKKNTTKNENEQN